MTRYRVTLADGIGAVEVTASNEEQAAIAAQWKVYDQCGLRHLPWVVSVERVDG